VLRDRPELKLTLGTVLMFPFYRTWCLIFRLYSLLRNVIMYSTWVRKFIRISVREQDMHDIPPVPYITNPDWFTIWHASTVEEDNDEVRDAVLVSLFVVAVIDVALLPAGEHDPKAVLSRVIRRRHRTRTLPPRH
jgi:hypothetical protein